MPDTMQPAPLPSVYQLRVVVRGVSPLIWRRLLIPADTTIADLHAVLQVTFGWTDTQPAPVRRPGSRVRHRLRRWSQLR
ncbi:MAG TPA: hypothetical protein VFC16_00170 [Nakamurella sp.]|nr:hypothetical protein [Nakamurella sp.]